MSLLKLDTVKLGRMPKVIKGELGKAGKSYSKNELNLPKEYDKPIMPSFFGFMKALFKAIVQKHSKNPLNVEA